MLSYIFLEDWMAVMNKKKSSFFFGDIQDIQKNMNAFKPEETTALNEFESFLLELSTKFIHLPYYRISNEIENGLKLMVRFLNVDRAALLEISSETGKIFNTHKWARDAISLLPEEVIKHRLPWCQSQFFLGKMLVFPDIEDMPAEADIDKNAFRRMGQKSLLAVPMIVGEKVIGTIGYASLNAIRRWDPAIISRSVFVSQIFANALIRMRTEQALHKKNGGA